MWFTAMPEASSSPDSASSPGDIIFRKTHIVDIICDGTDKASLCVLLRVTRATFQAAAKRIWSGEIFGISRPNVEDIDHRLTTVESPVRDPYCSIMRLLPRLIG